MDFRFKKNTKYHNWHSVIQYCCGYMKSWDLQVPRLLQKLFLYALNLWECGWSSLNPPFVFLKYKLAAEFHLCKVSFRTYRQVSIQETWRRVWTPCHKYFIPKSIKLIGIMISNTGGSKIKHAASLFYNFKLWPINETKIKICGWIISDKLLPNNWWLMWSILSC